MREAELDFLCEFADRIFPLEVKAGINPKSKSLKSYELQYKPARLMRTNLLNFKKDGKIGNLPLYAASQLARLMAADLENVDSRYTLKGYLITCCQGGKC